jgi:hypothetical protein
MALSLAAAARRLAPRAQGGAARLLGSDSAGGEKILDIDALRAARQAALGGSADAAGAGHEAAPQRGRTLNLDALRAQRPQQAAARSSRERAGPRAAPGGPRLPQPASSRPASPRRGPPAAGAVAGFTDEQLKLIAALAATVAAPVAPQAAGTRWLRPRAAPPRSPRPRSPRPVPQAAEPEDEVTEATRKLALFSAAEVLDIASSGECAFGVPAQFIAFSKARTREELDAFMRQRRALGVAKRLPACSLFCSEHG